jgi:multicomponent K+:H+ antiporter subunit F
MSQFFQVAAGFAAWCCAIAMLLALVRLLRGPSAQDRVLAFDSLSISAMLTLLILGIRSASTVYFDVALLMALFGFIGTMALAKFLLHGEVIEP